MSAADIAAYLDHQADAAATEQIEAHLAECESCRREVIETRRILRNARGPSRFLVFAGTLAAAAVLVVVTLSTTGGNEGIWRDGSAGSEQRLVAYGPLGFVSTAALRFVWASAPGAMTYRLTVTEADGTPIWTSNTADTSTAPGPDHALSTGVPYYWVADALMPDGSARTTGIHAFRIER